jgi:hypothetical protein
MALKFRATFDGQAFWPEGPVDLKPNEQYEVTVSPTEPPTAQGGEPYILTRLLAMATDMGVDDLSVHHKEYARGLKKIPPEGE